MTPYALTNEAEFLAVASEYFFEKPDAFQDKHPQLYDMMSKMFMQNPTD
ncbi:MAG: zinc-dependent peptidase [Pelobium sp.]